MYLNTEPLFYDKHYNPNSGRFLSEDPIGFAGRDFNLYRYVGNNPNFKIDPTGQNALVGVVGACIAVQSKCQQKKKDDPFKKQNFL